MGLLKQCEKSERKKKRGTEIPEGNEVRGGKKGR